jgi:hypothetical protein
MKLHELIDLTKVRRGHDPINGGHLVVGSTGHYKDIVVFRGLKSDAEDFLVNPNNAYRISKKWPEVYISRRMEVGDKFDPKLQAKYDDIADYVHLMPGSN